MLDTPIKTETTQIAVVGCGAWGQNLIRNLSELGRLAGVYDANGEAAEAFATKYDVNSLSLNDISVDPNIRGVMVATPPEWHYEVAKKLLLADKHVFVEKPLALEIWEAEELCTLAAERERILMVGHLLQYHPVFRKLKDMLQEGQLGKLQYIYSNRLNLGKIRQMENSLWSLAPHDISMILSMVGTEPLEVRAHGAAYLHKDIADVTTTHLTFPGGERAHIFVSWLHPFKEQKLVVVGEDAMAVFDDGVPWAEKLALYPHKIDWVDGMPAPERADAIFIEVEEDEPLKLECQHFIDCITEGTQPITDGAEGMRVLRVLEAAHRSLDEDHTVALSEKPQSETPGRTGFKNVQIHETAYVDPPCEIGEGTRIWHFSHVMPSARIGKDVSIGQNVTVEREVVVGDNCKVQNNVSLYKGVILEDGVFCGPSCVFTNVINPRAKIERKDEFKETLVKTGASIGANATIVCGSTLGQFAFIAAGAVVTKDVPDFALMAGVPARRIGWMSRAGEKLGPDLVCPREGRRYRETGPDELEEVGEED